MIPDTNQETSKTSSINTLILKAWRERWSDLQWGINIKTVLPRGVSGDVYNLAECILQQATTGPGLNPLLISYLKHSLSSQLISYAAVLKQISKFDQFHKPFCILQFLQFFESIQLGITCRSKPEEVQMPSAVLQFVNWLMKTIYYFTFENPHLNYQLCTSHDIADRATKNLRIVFESDFLSAMLHLGRYLEKEHFQQTIEIVNELEKNAPVHELRHRLKSRLQKPHEPQPHQFVLKSLNYSIQIVLANCVTHESVLRVEPLVRQLLVIKRLQNYSFAQIDYEVIRAAFYSLANACDTRYEKSWGAFVFIFVPKVLRKLSTISERTSAADSISETFDCETLSIDELLGVDGGATATAPTVKSELVRGYSDDVVHAIELLLEHSDLLNTLDLRSASNCFEYFLGELQKLQLLNESFVQYFMEARQIPQTVKIGFGQLSSPGIRKFIVKAEQSLVGILKTLNGDNYAKAYEALGGMLSQMLATKSLDLILAVAKADGKLQLFVSKLIKFNETALKPIDLNACVIRSSQNALFSKAVFFDVSLIILCSICDKFGFDVISNENHETFFAKWARQNLECSEPRPSYDDGPKAEQLLQFLCTSSSNAHETLLQTKWQQVLLQHVPAVMQQVMVAYDNGLLTANTLQSIVAALRKFKLCSILMSAAVWLSTNTKGGLRQQADSLIGELLAPFPLTANNGGGGGGQSDDKFVSIEHLNDRLSTAYEIIKHLQNDNLMDVMPKTRYLSGDANISDLINDCWQSIYETGTIDSDLAVRFKYLFETSGSFWFVSQLTKEIFNSSNESDLDKTIDLIFALFSFFIEDCTIVLITDILPTYLFNKSASIDLNIPQSLALAKLVVYCLNMCLETVRLANDGHASANRNVAKKRTFHETIESNDVVSLSASKVLKLNDNSTIFTAGENPMAVDHSSATTASDHPLTVVLHEFFSRCETFLTQNKLTISKRMYFIVNLLRLMADKMTECKTIVFRHLSATIVPTILKSMPDLFTYDLLLDLYDKETVTGINNASRDLCLLRNHQLKK